MDLSIVIVNWNTKDLLQNCLASIYENTRNLDLEVIVVDNASKYSSSQMVSTLFPQVKLIQNSQNLGFAKASNQGIETSKGEKVLLLNPDTKILPGSLQKMVDFLDKNPSIDILGPRLLKENFNQQGSVGHFPTLFVLLNHALGLDRVSFLARFLPVPFILSPHPIYQKSKFVPWVSGACLMFQRELLEKVGFLDENFFLYLEDVDFCYRAYKEGQKVFHLSEAEVIHLGEGSTKNVKVSLIARRFESLVYFYRKHYSVIAQALLRPLLILYLIPRIIFSLLFWQRSRLKAYCQAFKILWQRQK